MYKKDSFDTVLTHVKSAIYVLHLFSLEFKCNAFVYLFIYLFIYLPYAISNANLLFY